MDIVIGGSKGIGKGIGRAMAEAGAAVAVLVSNAAVYSFQPLEEITEGDPEFSGRSS